MEQKKRRMTKEELEAVEAARKAARDMLVMMAFAVVMVVVVFILTIVFVVPKITGDKKDDSSKETTMITSDPVLQPLGVYNLKCSEKNVYIEVDGSSTGDSLINVRTEPGMSDKYKAGQIRTGTKFVVDRYYFYGDYNNDFIGFPADEVKDLIDVDDADNILWMSLYYLHVDAYALPETYEMPENTPIKELSGFTTLTIVGDENPNIRSTPETKSPGNIYGKVPVGTVVEAISAILTTDTGNFYGIQLADVEFAIEEIGYGHLWYDQDHVLWISKDYVKLT